MSQKKNIDSAMILAAGLGKRIRAASDVLPKPLIKVAGKELIDYALCQAIEFGVNKVIINTHFKAKMIENYITSKYGQEKNLKLKNMQFLPDIKILYEPYRLETGGGVKNALPLLGKNPFFVMNSDSIFHSHADNPLSILASCWNGETMDALLLVCSIKSVQGYSGFGDFKFVENGNFKSQALKLYSSQCSPIVRDISNNKNDHSIVFTGLQICSPRLFNNAPKGAYSLNLHYDQAIKKKRLYAVVYSGTYYHVGSIEGLRLAEKNIIERAKT